MYIAIDGVDITKYIAHGGVKWQRADIDAPGSGRTMNGTMMRGRVATKMRLDLTCRPLRKEEMLHLQNLLYPEFVTVEYDDFLLGRVAKIMYANNITAEYAMERENGVEWIHNISIPLVER